MLLLARSWVFFSSRGFIFQDIHTKQVRSSSISGYKMQKIYGGKIYSCSAPLAWNYTNRISSQKMAQEVWNIKLDWKSQLLFKLYADKVQSYCITDFFKVDEQTLERPVLLTIIDLWFKLSRNNVLGDVNVHVSLVSILVQIYSF